jgi:hypothetical protein
MASANTTNLLILLCLNLAFRFVRSSAAKTCQIFQKWGNSFYLIKIIFFTVSLELEQPKKSNISSLASLCQNRFPLGNICFGHQPCPAHNTGNYRSYLNRRDLLTGNASFSGMKEPGNESFIDAPRGLEKEYPHAL